MDHSNLNAQNISPLLSLLKSNLIESWCHWPCQKFPPSHFWNSLYFGLLIAMQSTPPQLRATAIIFSQLGVKAIILLLWNLPFGLSPLGTVFLCLVGYQLGQQVGTWRIHSLDILHRELDVSCELSRQWFKSHGPPYVNISVYYLFVNFSQPENCIFLLLLLFICFQLPYFFKFIMYSSL